MNQQKRESWWSRNWKWFVPVVSLGFFLMVVAFIAVFWSLVFDMMKSSDPYKIALARATADSSVVEALGIPIEEGLFVFGSISFKGSSGNADLRIPISGPNGKATIFVTAAKSAGKWELSTLVVKIKGTGRRIDMLE